MKTGRLHIKRVYEPIEAEDGYRVLVDRLWPRGVTKSDGKFDQWLKTIAPSAELRKWFGHQVDRFPRFKEKYVSELKANRELETLQAILRDQEVVTLVYAAKDEIHNHARVLQLLLQSKPAE